jgi:hypothetical protein
MVGGNNSITRRRRVAGLDLLYLTNLISKETCPCNKTWVMYRYAKTMTATKKIKAAHIATTEILPWSTVNVLMAKSCKSWSSRHECLPFSI